MSGQANLDAIIDIGPLGMMVGTLGEQSDARHEAKCLDKILEAKRTADPLLIGINTPFGQIGECGLTLRERQ